LTTPKFTCEACGKTFPTGWTDAEARAEAKANGWGDIAQDDMAIICDDCYKEIRAWMQSL